MNRNWTQFYTENSQDTLALSVEVRLLLQLIFNAHKLNANCITIVPYDVCERDDGRAGLGG